MATLVSPGVSVTVTNQSFFIPATAPTVPLLFIATQAQKTQPDGITPAQGTYEHDVVETVTSLQQSTTLYGIPAFLTDPVTGAPFIGDARNEYGLYALNEFLGQGNLAYVIRANVNLNDQYTALVALWESMMNVDSVVLQNNIAAFLQQYNTTNGFVPSSPATSGFQVAEFGQTISPSEVIPPVGSPSTHTATITVDGTAHVVTITINTIGTFGNLIASLNAQLGGAAVVSRGTGAGADDIIVTSATTGSTSSVSIVDNGIFANLPGFVAFEAPVAGQSGYRTTVTGTELISLVISSTTDIFTSSSFVNVLTFFLGTVTSPEALPVFPGGMFQNPPVPPPYDGLSFIATHIALYPSFPGGGTVAGEFTPAEGAALLLACADEFQFTLQFLNGTSLGANDAARRAKIVQALTATIESNTQIRSETFEYNLVLCPGYSECVAPLLSLVQSINNEAIVIGDTPNNLSPDGITNPSTGWAVTTNRVISTSVAYYYPWGNGINLNGATVFVAPSGIALRTYAFSDNVSYVWFAPAGINRGLIDPNITDLGYVTGTLGTSNVQFVSTHLNQGQRDALYQYTASGGINPLAFFPGTGFVVWGQKMSVGQTASAEDRVNVARLLAYVVRSLSKGAKPFVFEPNDTLTQNNLKAFVDNFLQGIMANRGLFDFATICDSTNNPPAVVQQNQLVIDVALQPEIAAEFILIPITVFGPTATLPTG